MDTLSLRPAYIPLIQKPNCCAVTCLQMILYRNGLGLYDQEDLAVEFEVRIDACDAAAFRTTMPIMTQANLDEGIQTVESEERINAFFRAHAFCLKARSFKASAIPSLKDFLRGHMEKNHDIWVEYHGHAIHAGDSYQGQYIHDGLVEGMDLTQETVTVIDPAGGHRQRLHIPLSALERSVSAQYGRETGFVVVEKR